MKNKLPKNWIETDLDTVVLRMTNGSSLKQHEVEFEGSFPISRIETIWNETIDLKRVKYVEASDSDIEKYGLLKGDVLFSHINSDKHLGKTAVFNLDKTIIHGINLLLLRAMPQFNGDLLNYTLRHYRFSGKFIEVAQRSVNQSSINQKKLKSFVVPLPPLKEQQRIVAKLDTLFTHLEVLNTRLATIPQLLKNFKQAVLTQAVTGKLTEEWRGSKSVKIDSPITIGSEFKEKPKGWVWDDLVNISKLESGHTPRKSKQEYWINGDVPWISLQDIRAAHGTILMDTKFMPNMEGINNSSARILPKGTVCFSRDISVGYTTIMGTDMATTQHFANWICGKKLYNKYLLYAFISAKDFLIAAGKGTTVKTIYMPALKQFKLLLPPKEEQIEIVKRVENLFVKADKIEEHYKILKEKTDSLPQAILAKAFKGELVEQLPTDGDAKELLEEITKLKAAVAPKKKTKKKAKV